MYIAENEGTRAAQRANAKDIYYNYYIWIVPALIEIQLHDMDACLVKECSKSSCEYALLHNSPAIHYRFPVIHPKADITIPYPPEQSHKLQCA